MSKIESVHAVAIGFTRILDKPKSFTEIDEFIIEAEKDVKKEYPQLTVSIQWEGGLFFIGYDHPGQQLAVEWHIRKLEKKCKSLEKEYEARHVGHEAQRDPEDFANHPELVWVICNKEETGWIAGENGLLVFTGNEEADKYLQNTGDTNGVPKLFSWDECVNKFRKKFSCATVNHKGKPDYYRTIALTKYD